MFDTWEGKTSGMDLVIKQTKNETLQQMVQSDRVEK
jgi:hypothetical protein